MNYSEFQKLVGPLAKPHAPYRGEPIGISRRRGPKPGALAASRRVTPVLRGQRPGVLARLRG